MPQAEASPLEMSNQGLELLMQREGSRNEAYLDSQGNPTIGVGHTGPDVWLGLYWTDAQIAAALAKDMARFEAAINREVSVPLTQYQFDALGSFVFNVGEGAFMSSTLLRKLNRGDFNGAAAAFDSWHIPPEIISRRNGEREQFKGTVFEARIALDDPRITA